MFDHPVDNEQFRTMRFIVHEIDYERVLCCLRGKLLIRREGPRRQFKVGTWKFRVDVKHPLSLPKKGCSFSDSFLSDPRGPDLSRRTSFDNKSPFLWPVAVLERKGGVPRGSGRDMHPWPHTMGTIVRPVHRHCSHPHGAKPLGPCNYTTWPLPHFAPPPPYLRREN